MKNLLILIALLSSLFLGCKKQENSYDAQKQLQIDETLIKNFIAANNIGAQRHESGVYYVIQEPGDGNVQYTANSVVNFKYSIKLLNGTVIPQTTEAISYPLGQLIVGWQYGMPLIQPGGKIRLIIPSVYAYGPYSQGQIPANAVLDFNIELLDVSN